MFPWECILYVVPTCFTTIIRCNRDISLHPKHHQASTRVWKWSSGPRLNCQICGPGLVSFKAETRATTSRETSPIQIGKMSFLSNEWYEWEMLFCSWRVEFQTPFFRGKRAATWVLFFKVSYRFVGFFLFGFVFVVCDVLCRRHFSRRSAADPMPEIDFEKDKRSAGNFLRGH